MSETCWPAERFVAQTTHIWTVVAVLMLMSLQYKTSLKGFTTFLTYVRACFRVLCVSVGSQCISSVGAVITLITGIWLLSCKLQINNSNSETSHSTNCLNVLFDDRNVRIM